MRPIQKIMMKKNRLTILAAVLCAVCLSGCEGQKTQEQIDTYMESRITEFNYKGHKFLLYKQRYAKGGITHDPDCPCHKEGGEE